MFGLIQALVHAYMPRTCRLTTCAGHIGSDRDLHGLGHRMHNYFPDCDLAVCLSRAALILKRCSCYKTGTRIVHNPYTLCSRFSRCPRCRCRCRCRYCLSQRRRRARGRLASTVTLLPAVVAKPSNGHRRGPEEEAEHRPGEEAAGLRAGSLFVLCFNRLNKPINKYTK